MNYKAAIAKAFAVFAIILAVYVFLEGEKVHYGVVRAMYDAMGVLILIGAAVVILSRQE